MAKRAKTFKAFLKSQIGSGAVLSDFLDGLVGDEMIIHLHLLLEARFLPYRSDPLAMRAESRRCTHHPRLSYLPRKLDCPPHQDPRNRREQP